MTAPDSVTTEEVARLLAAIYPTRVERVLAWFVTWAYQHPEGGAIDRLGDRADDARFWNLRRRVRRAAAKDGKGNHDAPSNGSGGAS